MYGLKRFDFAFKVFEWLSSPESCFVRLRGRLPGRLDALSSPLPFRRFDLEFVGDLGVDFRLLLSRIFLTFLGDVWLGAKICNKKDCEFFYSKNIRNNKVSYLYISAYTATRII